MYGSKINQVWPSCWLWGILIMFGCVLSQLKPSEFYNLSCEKGIGLQPPYFSQLSNLLGLYPIRSQRSICILYKYLLALPFYRALYPQQTRGMEPMLFQCWPTGAEPTLEQHWFIFSCLQYRYSRLSSLMKSSKKFVIMPYKRFMSRCFET